MKPTSRSLSAALAAAVLLAVPAQADVASRPSSDASPSASPRVIDLRAMPTLDQIIPRLDRARVVLVGETHDRLDHHLNQLEVIRRLHAHRKAIAIGMEFFQQPYQAALDEYVAGRISEPEMLARTEYFDRWRFDYRLYRPILQYAREHGIPLVALNLPAEVTGKVGRSGIESLTEAERASIPTEIDRSDEAYHTRLKAIFEQHPSSGHQAFERWLDVQLLWDEGMAERAARYLADNPRTTLVVLAGSGHLAYRSGIPIRLERRSGGPVAVLLPVESAAIEPGLADYLLTSEEEKLPPVGRLGAMMNTEQEGQVVVASLEPGSAAGEAGIRDGDRVVAIDGAPIARFADVRVALWDKHPGDPVTVDVTRKRWFGAEERLSLLVTLR